MNAEPLAAEEPTKESIQKARKAVEGMRRSSAPNMDRAALVKFKAAINRFILLMEERINVLQAAGGETEIALLEIGKAEAAVRMCVAFRGAVLDGLPLKLSLPLEGQELVPPPPPPPEPEEPIEPPQRRGEKIISDLTDGVDLGPPSNVIDKGTQERMREEDRQRKVAERNRKFEEEKLEKEKREIEAARKEEEKRIREAAKGDPKPPQSDPYGDFFDDVPDDDVPF